MVVLFFLFNFLIIIIIYFLQSIINFILQEGIIIKLIGSWYDVCFGDGSIVFCCIGGKFCQEDKRFINFIVVGDWVCILIEVDDEGIGVICEILFCDNFVV